jgi:hypothetical protein
MSQTHVIPTSYDANMTNDNQKCEIGRVGKMPGDIVFHSDYGMGKVLDAKKFSVVRVQFEMPTDPVDFTVMQAHYELESLSELS